ncbi:MAG: hypothetical protein AADX96_18870 [Thiocapsa sp. C3-sup]|uniref:hypothetical protein n=1 Tax=unclassified Thiocapsa TaxID=2641286 RepID=UPI0035ADC83B
MAWEDLRLRIPALEHRLLHNALHHQVQDQGFDSGRRSLRQLHEFARLRALPAAAAIDWPRLLAELDRLGPGNAVRGWLLAAERLFGQPLPPAFDVRHEARFPGPPTSVGARGAATPQLTGTPRACGYSPTEVGGPAVCRFRQRPGLADGPPRR